MKKLLFAVIVSAAWIHAAAALTTRQGTKRPSFEDFRVTEVFRAGRCRRFWIRRRRACFVPSSDAISIGSC